MEPTHTISSEDLLSHLAWSRALARRLVGDDATADDVVQESFAAALRRPPERDGPLKPWLARVVQNVARQRARSEGRRTERERAAASPEALPSAFELTARAEAQRQLIDALLELDETSREIVLLRYFEELSSAEIARRTGRPAGTIRSRLKRAIDELRSKLDEQHGGDRDSWRAALAPLALTPEAARSAASVSALGVGWKIAAAIVATFLVVIALRSVFSTSRTPDSGPNTRVAMPSSAPAVVGEEPLPEATFPRGRRPAEAAPANEPDANVAVVGAGFGDVLVRFVDAGGEPVSGIKASSRSVPPVACGADGRVTLRVWYGGERDRPAIDFVGPGFAADTVNASGRSGETVDLGDVLVHPGGSIEGTVVGPAGEPAPGVRVRVLGRERRATTTGGMQVGSYTRLGAVEATSDATGRFRLTGVVAGEVRVDVDDDSEQVEGASEPVLVVAGSTAAGVVVVARPVDPDTLIEGRVLGPDGEPVPYIMVRGKWTKWLTNGSSATSTDSAGRFRITVGSRAKTALTVRRRDPDVLRGELRGLRGGARDVVLQLAAPGRFEIDVAGPSGAPVLGARVELRSEGETEAGNEATENGRYRVPVPSKRFRAHVLADGFAEAVLGPFDPEALPPRTRVTLEPLPQLTGFVTADGAPATGARVVVRAVAPDKTLYAGLPSLVTPSPIAETRTGPDGRFALTVRERGRVVVRAEHDDFAPFEWDAVDYRPASGLDVGAAVLGAGGSLEGVVLDGDAIQQRHVVLASRGDGVARTVRTEPDGSFRFTRLTPGPWMVRVVPEPVLPEGAMVSSTTGRPYRDFQADAIVAEGRTTRFDPVIGALQARTVVRGSFSLEGLDAARFSVELVTRDVPASTWTMAERARVRGDGSFEVRGGAAGRYVLLFVDREAEGEDGLRLIRELDLVPGETRVDVRAAMGAVTAGPAASRVAERLLWRGGDGTFALAPIPEPGARQAFPAGVVQRVGFEAIAASRLDAVDVREQGTLAAGGELALGR
ncbi:MAG: sigma-70 family RNA polymerase sigma factor [Planctomycetota bacterium]